MGWGCEGISRSASYTRSEKPTRSLSLYRLMQEQKIMWVNFMLFVMGMEWELQVMGQRIFGAPVITNTTSDMSSMAQE